MSISDDSTLIIAGRNAVREILERNPASIDKVCLQQYSNGLKQIRILASKAGVPIQFVPQDALRRLTGGVVHQGVVAKRAVFTYTDYSDMLSAISTDLDVVRSTRPRLLLLDGIQDPRNFGAIIRSAVAFGVKGVIVSSHHMAPVNAAMVKASSGTALRIPIAQIQRLSDVILELQERGYIVYGASVGGDCSMWNIDWKCPIALVVGSEARGLYPDTERVCDHLISIPMGGDAESLNASVSTGILLALAFQPGYDILP